MTPNKSNVQELLYYKYIIWTSEQIKINRIILYVVLLKNNSKNDNMYLARELAYNKKEHLILHVKCHLSFWLKHLNQMIRCFCFYIVFKIITRSTKIIKSRRKTKISFLLITITILSCEGIGDT